ncbi:expressed unknown protein [Seminavis robusta]|uniref:Uncharacterized protein n=1 Tax=Seminavis robusta TaxID=568900 RepID=A0A9N8EK79_9STRA|nr:expressed unknown protein [Seminavis robusta]|eukprot:Sro1244_g255620.1 n/a (96) ;mRNA; f:27123-27410
MAWRSPVSFLDDLPVHKKSMSSVTMIVFGDDLHSLVLVVSLSPVTTEQSMIFQNQAINVASHVVIANVMGGHLLSMLGNSFGHFRVPMYPFDLVD